MKDRPILFSGAMVRALLDGTKTQTRRVISAKHLQFFDKSAADQVGSWNDRPFPFGRPGDRLWVRETFKPIASGQVKGGYGKVRYGFAYQADGATKWARHETEIVDLTGKPPTGPMQFQDRPWKPSIHMPKRASRITLEITGVRVQRLQDISAEDCIAEGIEEPMAGHWRIYGRETDGKDVDTSPRTSFRSLWESLNGTGSWDANPWVWALTFKRI